MAKVSKEEIARIQGLQRALEIAKKGGIEALEYEVKFRSATHIPIKVNYEDAFKAIEEVATALAKRYAENTLPTVMAMAMLVNTEEFNHKDKELKRFKKKFNENTEQLRVGDIKWGDIQELFKDEYGINLGFNTDILSIDKESEKRAKDVEREKRETQEDERRNRKVQGSRLRDCRKLKNLSQVSLGKEVGCSGVHISQLERGSSKLSQAMAEKIAKALDVKTDYILNKSNCMEG